jgi:peptidoglycan/xylan/chitin deacetylase (PgdA/CDA1 family)
VLRKRGFSLGSHGTTHRALTFLPSERCLAELTESKAWLEDVIGEEVRYLAAPGGFINSRVMHDHFFRSGIVSVEADAVHADRPSCNYAVTKILSPNLAFTLDNDRSLQGGAKLHCL